MRVGLARKEGAASYARSRDSCVLTAYAVLPPRAVSSCSHSVIVPVVRCNAEEWKILTDDAERLKPSQTGYLWIPISVYRPHDRDRPLIKWPRPVHRSRPSQRILTILSLVTVYIELQDT